MVKSDAGALMVSGDPLFSGHRRQLVALATRRAIPAVYDVREYIDAGRLISYAASFTEPIARLASTQAGF